MVNNNKAFTLIELLAVIIILAIILIIAIPQINKVIKESRTSLYNSNLKLLTNSAENYIAKNIEKVPVNNNEVSLITLDELINSGYIKEIKDLTNKSISCTGYVIVSKNTSSYLEYTPNLKCGDNFETENYINSSSLDIEILVVAGGGSAGSSSSTNGGSGGGGAGGLIYYETYPVNIGQSYNVVVGNGGAGQTNTQPKSGVNGGDSIFGTLTAVGGGAGGSGSEIASTSGGSGGGAGYKGYNYIIGSNGTSGQGNKGGDVLGNNNGAGGGGAGGPGGNTTDTSGVAGGTGGIGGSGITLSISGTNVTYAKGGSGGGSGQPCGLSGTANTGNGGNGMYANQCALSGNGGSGVIIVKYRGQQIANGGSITSIDGYTIHTFLSGSTTFDVLDI